MYYKLVRRFALGLFRHRRRILESPQPVKSLAALTGVWLAASRTYGA